MLNYLYHLKYRSIGRYTQALIHNYSNRNLQFQFIFTQRMINYVVCSEEFKHGVKLELLHNVFSFLQATSCQQPTSNKRRTPNSDYQRATA